MHQRHVAQRARRNARQIRTLLASESRPLCEMSSEWTPMPQPLVVDSGAAETVIPRTWLPNHKTVDSEGSKHGDGAQLGKVTFQVVNVNKALGSVSTMVRNGNKVVFDASGSYIENKMTKDVLLLREREGVYVVDMIGAGRRAPEGACTCEL